MGSSNGLSGQILVSIQNSPWNLISAMYTFVLVITVPVRGEGFCGTEVGSQESLQSHTYIGLCILGASWTTVLST